MSAGSADVEGLLDRPSPQATPILLTARYQLTEQHA